MLEIIYEDDYISFNLPKNFLKDAIIRKFFKYLKALEIVNKSKASDEDIEEIVKLLKKQVRKKWSNC